MHEKDFWQIVAQGLAKSDFEWLEPLRAFVSSLIVFGCWDDGDTVRQCREPYVLLRILEATRAVVVDKEAEYLWNAQRWFQETQAERPELFGAYDLEFVVSDMTGETDELTVNGFDLAYCSGVLYFMRADAGNLQASINTMARVVKPGGWVIANEDEGLERQFEEAELEKATLDRAPEYAYCYRKPLVSVQGDDSSAGRVGAKRRIETKRVVHTAPLAWFRYAPAQKTSASATQPALAPVFGDMTERLQPLFART